MADTENINEESTTPFFRPLEEMTTDEKVDEILTTLRMVGVALTEFQKMGPGGLLKLMMSRG